MAKRPEFVWTKKQVDKLQKVQQILNDLKEFKPLTLRQIYYQLVSKEYIQNNVSQYIMLSKLLKYARIEGYINWNDIEDRVRSYHDLSGYTDSNKFINTELYYFLKNYSRNLIQDQEIYPEIWIEKDALSSIFVKTCNPYTIPVVVCKGFSSISFLNDYKQRVLSQQDKTPYLLYFGDFDPSGVEMLLAMETTLQSELNLKNVVFKRIGLLEEDIYKYKLPHSPDALKKTDPRAEKHLKSYGELAVELDALPPNVLQNKITDSIRTYLDISKINKQIEIREKEFNKLNLIKKEVSTLIQNHI